jgi:hypothetical protein
LHLPLWPRCARHCSVIWLKILVRMKPVTVIILLVWPLTVLRWNALQRAGHAVLRTLYSRAYRVGLGGASWSLRGLRKKISFDLVIIAVGRMLIEPAFEVVAPKQELERFARDVGRSRVDELGAIVQLRFDFFLQANLKSCGFRSLRWCVQQCHVCFLLVV